MAGFRWLRGCAAAGFVTAGLLAPGAADADVVPVPTLTGPLPVSEA